MLTISKPLSAGQAQSYHAEEFSNSRENYYTEAEQIRGNGTEGSPSSGDYVAKCARNISSGSRKDNTQSLANNSSATKRPGNT